ncbi:MAG: hypothetical protein RQ758_07230 [Methanomicrobiaceae archaeon]|nr:hypothetical protein [Methanomicrobiaceae archaeon]
MEGAVLSPDYQFVPVARRQHEFCQLPACFPWPLPENAGDHLNDAEEAFEAGGRSITDACRPLASCVRTAESAGHDLHARRNRRTDHPERALQRILALPTSQALPGGIFCSSSGCGQAKGTNQEANPTPTSSPSLVAALLTLRDTHMSIAIILPREVI